MEVIIQEYSNSNQKLSDFKFDKTKTKIAENKSTETNVYKDDINDKNTIIKTMNFSKDRVGHLYTSARYELLCHALANRIYHQYNCRHFILCKKIKYNLQKFPFVVLYLERCETNLEIFLVRLLKSFSEQTQKQQNQKITENGLKWMVRSLMIQSFISVLQFHSHLGISHNDFYLRNAFVEKSAEDNGFYSYYNHQSTENNNNLSTNTKRNFALLQLPYMGWNVKMADFGVVTSPSWTPDYHLYGENAKLEKSSYFKRQDLTHIRNWNHTFSYSNLHWNLRDYYAIINNFYKELIKHSPSTNFFDEELSWCEFLTQTLWDCTHDCKQSISFSSSSFSSSSSSSSSSSFLMSQRIEQTMENCIQLQILDWFKSFQSKTKELEPNQKNKIQPLRAKISISDDQFYDWTFNQFQKLHLLDGKKHTI
jgi:hypothetical protein